LREKESSPLDRSRYTPTTDSRSLVSIPLPSAAADAASVSGNGTPERRVDVENDDEDDVVVVVDEEEGGETGTGGSSTCKDDDGGIDKDDNGGIIGVEAKREGDGPLE